MTRPAVRNTRGRAVLWLPGLLLLVLAACGDDGVDRAPRGESDRKLPAFDARLARNGERHYRDPDFGRTGVACADCHSDADESVVIEGVVRAGHSLVGAAGRTSVWNGEFTGADIAATAAGAAKCAHEYQERGESLRAALAPEEAAALLAYFAAISTGAEAKTLRWETPPRPGQKGFVKEAFVREMESILRLRGNAERGIELFSAACALCHGDNARGSGPPLRRLRDYADRVPALVRGGSDAMPFFSRDRLSDQDIADLREYILRAAR